MRVNDLKNSSLERRISAQVLCLDPDTSPSYVAGLTYVDGRSLGIIANTHGTAIRDWQKVDFVINYIRKHLGSMLINTNIVDVRPENAKMIEIFVHTFQFDERVLNESLDRNRSDILAKLKWAIAHGSERNSANP